MTQFPSDLEFNPQGGLDVFDGDHLDGVPRAAVQEAAVGALADALLAADAEIGVNLDAAEGRVVLVRDPVHAVFDGAVRHAGRRPGATRAALRNDREFLGLLLARRIDALGLGLLFDHFSDGNEVLGQASTFCR